MDYVSEGKDSIARDAQGSASYASYDIHALTDIFGSEREADRFIDLSSSDTLQLALANPSRLAKIYGLGLFNIYRTFALPALFELEEDDFERVAKMARQYGGDKVSRFVDSLSTNTSSNREKILSIFDTNDTKHAIGGLLLQNTEPYLAQDILSDDSAFSAILSHDDPEQWLLERFQLQARVIELGGDTFARDRRSLISIDAQKVESIAGVEDENLRKELLEHALGNPEESNDLFQKFVDLWKDLPIQELQDLCEKGVISRNDFSKSINTRASWILAIDEFLGRDKLKQMLINKDALFSFLKGAEAAHTLPISLAEQEKRKKRQSIPFETEPGLEDFEKEVLDIIRMGGLEPLLRQVALKINLVHPEKLRDARRSYSSFHGIFLRPAIFQQRARIPGTIIHEMGHGIQYALAGMPDGQAFVDRYAVRAMYGVGYQGSEYPEGVAKVLGRESVVFIEESFAEDVRILLTNPTLLTPARRTHIEQVFQMVFPDILLEDLRSKIRILYGNLYGVGVNDVQRQATCDTVALLANRYEKYIKKKK